MTRLTALGQDELVGIPTGVITNGDAPCASVTVSSPGSLILFRVTDWMIPIRVMPEQEAIGLDLSQHGEFIELEPMRQFGLTE